jgi:hypothetical protein
MRTDKRRDMAVHSCRPADGSRQQQCWRLSAASTGVPSARSWPEFVGRSHSVSSSPSTWATRNVSPPAVSGRWSSNGVTPTRWPRSSAGPSIRRGTSASRTGFPPWPPRCPRTSSGHTRSPTSRGLANSSPTFHTSGHGGALAPLLSPRLRLSASGCGPACAGLSRRAGTRSSTRRSRFEAPGPWRGWHDIGARVAEVFAELRVRVGGSWMFVGREALVRALDRLGWTPEVGVRPQPSRSRR